MRVNKKRNPYVGPRSFERTEWDRDHFFGRDRETQEIVSLMFTHPLLLVYAQSGAGKTSLFNAKIAPTLEEHGFQVLPLTRVSGPIPEGIQSQAIGNLYVFNALLGLQAEADPHALLDKSLAASLEERPRPPRAGGRPVWRALIFDQFEELFTSYPVGEREQHKEQRRFFEQVVEALRADPLLRVVLVIREDYLAQLDPFVEQLPDQLRVRFRLERLREEAALAAVTGPLEGTGRSFAEAAAGALVGDLMTIQVLTASGETEAVRGEFVEPVQLQVACRSLWEELPDEATVISKEDLKAYGDVDLALAGFYERCIARTARETSVQEGDLRAWFEKNLITPAGTRGTVYRGLEQTGGIPNPALDVLETLHLVRGEWRAGARWYELTHDRFIQPIQNSNARWGTEKRARRRRVVTGLAFVAVFLALLVVAGISARTAARRTATAAGAESQKTVTAAAAWSQKTAEAAGTVVQAAAAKAVTAEKEATQVAQQAEDSATAVKATAEKEVAQAAQQAGDSATAVKATAAREVQRAEATTTAVKATAEKEVAQAAQQAEATTTAVKATAEKEVEQAEATTTAVVAIVAAEQARKATRTAETPQLSQQGPAVDPLFSARWQELGGAGGPLGAPTGPAITDCNWAKQYFEQGFMYWWDYPDEDPIWVMAVPDPDVISGRTWIEYDAVISGTTWMEYDDRWDQDQPTFPPNCPEATEPLGPRRGFGVTWCDADGVKELVGVPLEREFGSGDVYPKAVVQRFEKGVMFDNLADREIWALINEDGWYRFRY